MQIVKVEPFKIIGITVRTSNQNGQAAKDIPALWDKFLKDQVLNQIPNRIDDTIYSIYTEYEGDHNLPYTTLIGCKVKSLDDVPVGLKGFTFGGGKYYYDVARGDLMKGIVIKKWMEIWEMDLDREYTADFDVYGPRAQNPADAEIEFYVAIKE